MKDEEKRGENFCEICGLKFEKRGHSLEEDKKVDDRIRKINLMKPGKYRINKSIDIHVGHPERSGYHVEYCAANSKKWDEQGKNCKDFILKTEGVNLSDYISIYTANKNARNTNKLMWIAIGIALLGLLFAIL